MNKLMLIVTTTIMAANILQAADAIKLTIDNQTKNSVTGIIFYKKTDSTGNVKIEKEIFTFADKKLEKTVNYTTITKITFENADSMFAKGTSNEIITASDIAKKKEFKIILKINKGEAIAEVK